MSDREKYRATLREQQRARELSPTPIPYRITTALNLRELYGPEVDRACGVEEPAVDQWETGELVPTRKQIEALAKLTDYPPHYFYKPIEDFERGGTAWICSRSRPKGKRCEQFEFGPPAPKAQVIPIAKAQRPALPYGWRCSIRPCSLRGRRYPAATEREAIDELNFHYDAQHAQQPSPAPTSTHLEPQP